MSPGLRLYIDFCVFLFGACIGSFLNVCIYRLPIGKSIVTPPSACPSCGEHIRWFDNIPLVSYLLLRGRCRNCRATFSVRYFFVELFTAMLFLAIWGKAAGWLAPIYWLFTGGLIVATFIDLTHYIIPDEITIGGVVVGLVASAVCPGLHGEAFFILGAFQSLLGMLVGSALIMWIAVFGEKVFKKEAMGFGDVKLMGMIGAFLGWKAAVFILMVSSVIGAVAGLLMVMRSRGRRQAVGGMKGLLLFWRRETHLEAEYLGLDDWRLSEETDLRAMGSSIPYGPYLAVGAVLWLFVAERVQTWFAPLLSWNE
jgi:leader peptidase (prepilin peptidase) / N-methyltransferase